MRPAKPKRGRLIEKLTHNDLVYLITGHDMFIEVNFNTIQQKWEAYRDQIMDIYKKGKETTLLNVQIKPQKGKFPFAWWIYDRKLPEDKINWDYVG